MNKWIIISTGTVAAIAILASTAIVSCFAQGSEVLSPRSSNVSLPLAEEAPRTLDKIEKGSNTQRPINEVKEDWEEKLMTLPGVMGVGIGLTKDRRETCIKIYVNRAASAQVPQIPEQIEGYPVEVELRGAFQPLK
jgi:hypothetical protein